VEERPCRSPETAYRSVSDEGGLVVLPNRSEVKVLNPVGTRIFELLDGTRTVGEIAATIANEYDVTTEQSRIDVDEFVASLRSHGMLAGAAGEANGESKA
jgi:hypothetical protein